MVLVPWILLAVAAPSEIDAGIDRAQLSRLLHATSAAMRDVEWIYEGSTRVMKSKRGPDAIDFEDDFQGVFAYRNDRSVHLDVYIESDSPKRPFQREIFALRGAELAQRLRTPDHSNPVATGDRSGVGGLGSLNRPRSPTRSFLLPHLLEYVDDPSWSVEPSGWEVIDGHRCLKILVTQGSRKHANHYWIDLERGGMPLRHEDFTDKGIRGRDFAIELARVSDKRGAQFWIPVRGKTHSFVTAQGVDRDPIFEEIYSVLEGTVRINQDLPDSRFTLDSESSLIAPDLAKQKSRYETALNAPKPRSQTPQEHIETLLAKADAQSKGLEASAPSRESWYQRNFLSILLVLGGGATLIAATFLLRRGR